MEEGTIRPNPTGRGEGAAKTASVWSVVDVLGVPVACVDPTGAVAMVRDWLEGNERNYLSLTGVHGVVEAQDDPQMLSALQGAGMNLPDGMPMVWAGRRAGSTKIERVYGPDLMLSLCAEAAGSGWPVYFYGGGPRVAETLSQRMSERFPGLAVAGVHCPPMRDAGEPEEDAVIEQISASGARIVFVGLSTPKQELWMANHLERLGGSVVLVGVGAAFDIHAGLRSDAPKWIGRLGLHWLYRLAQEPRRLWHRYSTIIPRYLRAIRKRPPQLIHSGAGGTAA